MPCGDITEQIELKLDQDHRIQSYRFSKKTCGGAIGMESLLLDEIGGMSPDSIIGKDDFSFFGSVPSADDVESFLKIKHLLAIQCVIRAFLGISSGAAGESCAIVSIEYDNGCTIIDADIDVDLLTDNIESCANCGPG